MIALIALKIRRRMMICNTASWSGWSKLNPKQREVLARRFGLMGYEPATLEEVVAKRNWFNS